MSRKMQKSVILYHRSYRKLAGSTAGFLVQFALISLPFAIIVAFYYPELSSLVCRVGEMLLSPALGGNVKIAARPMFDSIGWLYFLTLPGSMPSQEVALLNALFCLAVVLILPRVQTTKPLTILTIIFSMIHLVSSVFFTVHPTYFPYSLSDYSQLYMVQQMGIWFFAPLLMGLAIMPLPSSVNAKVFTMLFLAGYSILFGAIRYIVFLYALAKISVLYMALLFFALGPLIDFVYIVGLYSWHIYRLSNTIKGDYSLWHWRYRS